jgi:hypothetical protein
MKMKEKDKRENGKQAYEKPRLRSIELAAEEVLAVGCKTVSQTAPNNPSPPCMIRHCAGKGS